MLWAPSGLAVVRQKGRSEIATAFWRPAAARSPFETFTQEGSVPLLQARRKSAIFPRADFQTASKDRNNAAHRPSVSEAQEAAAAKLRTAFAFQNLMGPWQGSGFIV